MVARPSSARRNKEAHLWDSHSVAASVHPLDSFKQLTDFHKVWYGRYAGTGHSSVLILILTAQRA
jgi:hypothetical protein